jgi:hypothetical protein
MLVLIALVVALSTGQNAVAVLLFLHLLDEYIL